MHGTDAVKQRGRLSLLGGVSTIAVCSVLCCEQLCAVQPLLMRQRTRLRLSWTYARSCDVRLLGAMWDCARIRHAIVWTMGLSFVSVCARLLSAGSRCDAVTAV